VHPHTHLTTSWLVGHRLPERRDRLLVTWAGMAPDLDGLSLLANTDLYARWHHVLTHGAVAAVVTTAVCAACARARFKVAALSFAAFHLHLVCDLLGSGVAWSIAYLYPFSAHRIATPFGWSLDSWQNAAVTAAALAACVAVGLRRGYTVTESFLPLRIDREVVRALRTRFGAEAARRPAA
jgi:inner membrane protein